MRSLRIAIAFALAVLSVPAVAMHHEGKADALAAVLAHERRAEDKVRDAHRHPEKTLRFFDIQPTHTVVEYAPGRGWYTRILAPYVADQGRYLAVSFSGSDVPIERLQKLLEGWAEKFPGRVEEMSGVPASSVRAYYGSAAADSEEGQVDRVVISRMLHNLLRWGIASRELRALRKMLKDDGLVGVVQHRAREDAPYSESDGSKGYLHEQDVIALMRLNGFTLVSKSEINANPKDPANHEAGVWTLPPSYRQGDQDKDKYTAIGESDRMTLLFKKSR